eukprot:COSAG02_NODE_30712_length_546_cov_1.279642_1_plen_45_part_10
MLVKLTLGSRATYREQAVACCSLTLSRFLAIKTIPRVVVRFVCPN